MSNSGGFILNNNSILNGRIRLSFATNGSLLKNRIVSKTHGVRIDAGCHDIAITDNNISVDNDKYQCVWQNNTDSTNIEILNNVCE